MRKFIFIAICLTKVIINIFIGNRLLVLWYVPPSGFISQNIAKEEKLNLVPIQHTSFCECWYVVNFFVTCIKTIDCINARTLHNHKTWTAFISRMIFRFVRITCIFIELKIELELLCLRNALDL